VTNPFLLLECEHKAGPKCKWQITNRKDQPSQPCQDSCGLRDGEICDTHERQVQRVPRLKTCTHGKPGTKTTIAGLYNGKVAGRSDVPFIGVPFADGSYPAVVDEADMVEHFGEEEDEQEEEGYA
jgi:hypothetical protein